MRLIEPPEGRAVFCLAFTPTPDDIDANGHVNNVVYLRWAQDMGVAHWNARASAEALSTYAWVALRHEIDYRRELKLGETAQGRTWLAAAAQGPRFDRYIRIDHPDGQMCAQIVTTWVFIDQVSRRPKRVPDWVASTFELGFGPSSPPSETV